LALAQVFPLLRRRVRHTVSPHDHTGQLAQGAAK
jgi:hypothetical protein